MNFMFHFITKWGSITVLKSRASVTKKWESPLVSQNKTNFIRGEFPRV